MTILPIDKQLGATIDCPVSVSDDLFKGFYCGEVWGCFVMKLNGEISIPPCSSLFEIGCMI